MKFSGLAEKPEFTEYINRIRTEYSEKCRYELPELTRRVFDIFYETGSRKEYEELYFSRRRALLICTLMCLIFDNDEYIKTLETVISSICDEFTWALPAHTDKDAPNPERVIDLFAAETGQALSEIYAMLGGRLSVNTLGRITEELKRRIADPFNETAFNWERSENNWSAVCGGSVGITLMYHFPEDFKRNEKRLLNIMDVYIGSFGDDGISREGLGYWNYGFWYFTGFADLYNRLYGVDIMNNAKVKSIAMCQQNLFLDKNTVVSFSDCTGVVNFNSGLAHYYRKKFGADIRIISQGFSDGIDHCSRLLPAVRSVLWYDESLGSLTDPMEHESYFSDSAWYINRGKRFALAAKSGYNDESHNHNDVGSFIIAADGVQTLADYGAAEYTRDYFSDKRYSFLATSSRGHSIPIIDGEYQKAGIEYGGVTTAAGGNKCVMEISGAYGLDYLSELKRTFLIDDNSVELTDAFGFSDNREHLVTERFISLIKPEVKNGRAVIGSVMLDCDKEPHISEEKLKAHLDGAEDTIYFIDYSAGKRFTITFRKS